MTVHRLTAPVPGAAEPTREKTRIEALASGVFPTDVATCAALQKKMLTFARARLTKLQQPRLVPIQGMTVTYLKR